MKPDFLPQTATVIAIATIFLAPASLAKEEKKPAPPIRPLAVVPYDPDKSLTEQEPDRFYLDYQTFQGMWKTVKEHRLSQAGESTDQPDAPAEALISTALYHVRMTPEKISVKGRIDILTRGSDWQKVPLPFAGTNVVSLLLDGETASYRDGAVMVEKRGEHLVEVRFEIPVSNRADTTKWKIPAAAGSLLQIELDSDLAEPVLNEGWPLAKSTTETGGVYYLAAVGNASDINLRRRLKTAGRGMTRPNLATIDARLFLANGLERLEADYQLQFPGQEDNRFTVSFDSSITPLEFRIPNLSSWELTEGESGQRQLTFSLTRPVRDELTVSFVGERLPSSNGDGEKTFPPLGADATRIDQRRALYRTGGLSVSPNPGPNHRQVSFPDSAADQSGFEPVAAYSLTTGGEDLAFSVEAMRAERHARASFVYQAGSGKVETIANFAIHSPEAPLLNNSFLIPAGSTVQLVEGNRIKDWWVTGDEVFVRYSGGTPEETRVLLYLTRPLEEADNATINIEPIRLSGFEDDELEGEGLIVGHVTREMSLSLGANQRVAREVGVDEVATNFEVIPPLERKRGFRFESAAFSGTLTTQPIDAEYDALWVMLARVHESWTRLSIRADVEVTRSGLDRVAFETPDSMPELRVVSDEVRELRHTVENGVRKYEAVFQQFVTGAISFTLECELPHAGESSLPDLAFPEASRQERFVIVENQSSERMSLETGRVEKTVQSLLPYAPGALNSAQLFRAQPGWSITANLESLTTTAGNDAVILYADLTTAIRANGEEWLKATYHLQNRSLQFLVVRPPQGSELISAVVANTEVRADRGDVGEEPAILIPLIQTEPGQLAYDVELVFRSKATVSSGESLPRKLERHLDDPQVIGPTIEKTLWQVYLPEDHHLTDVDSNMDRVAMVSNKLRKLQSDLQELKYLNGFSADGDNGLVLRNNSLFNCEVLAERIDQGVQELDSALSAGSSYLSYGAPIETRAYQQLKTELEAQKVIITENRIEMPKFNVREEADAESKEGRAKDISWFDNSAEIKSRNSKQTSELQRQIGLVESQVRLNDNISIETESIITQNDQDRKADDRNEYLGKLVDEGNKDKRISDKLSVLNTQQNFAQIGHGGVNSDGTTPQAVTEAEPLKQQLELVPGQKMGNARSGFSIKPEAAKEGGRLNKGADIKTKSEDFETMARLQVNVESQFGRQTADKVFRAEGRRSVEVEFPVEGTAYYFQKLKDHAEIELSSALPSDTNGIKWNLSFAACLLVILAGKLIAGRAKAKA